MSDKLSKLLDIGFVNAGEWKLKDGTLAYELFQHENESNILYSFIAQNDVKYIGKTTQTLKARMNGYKNPGPSQSTNIKNNRNIKMLLVRGTPVMIYAFVNNEPPSIKGISINLAAGLEDNLVATIKPDWNEAGKY